MKKGEVLQLNITDYAFEGKGIAKIEHPETEKKFVIFVHGAYPGDVVEAQIRKKKKSYAEAKAIKIISPSQERTSPKCVHFGVCGGCKSQDLKYEAQVKYKESQVKDIYERLGKLSGFEFLPIVPSDKIYNYRNKMEFSFSEKRWLTPEEISTKDEITNQDFALGLHIPRIYDKVLDLQECHLHSKLSDKILHFTREFFKEKGASIYSTKTHQGYLRHLVIKTAHHTNDSLVNLVTGTEDTELMKNYTESLINKFPEITTVVNNINLKKAQVALGDYEKVYHGDGYIFDFIGNKKYRISANSFFQTNTLQAERLYDVAMDFAGFNGNEIVYDLYSGAGTIAIYAADKVKEIYAVENVEAAVEDAKINMKLNNVENMKFLKADLNKSFFPVAKENNFPNPDIIIADPPRGGMNPKTVKDIIKFSPKKIIYVSCNPATQARDISELVEEGGYKLVKMQPVDMFPHTYHIENVALLVKE
jgi:23S rRNA (uracil1939-C5)-methyltransferase